MRKITIYLIAIACSLFTKAQNVVYLQSNNTTYYPNAYYWGQTGNQDALNAVFGSGNWQDLKLETVDATSILVPSVKLIFIDGSNYGTCSFVNFLNNNYSSLQNWVNAGGSLILNAAPNVCSGTINLYFGGVNLLWNPTLHGYISNANHPIFQSGLFQPSSAAVYYGTDFSHTYVSGTGLSNILTNDASQPILSETSWGTGHVIFGGLTLAFFESSYWTPQPNVFNLYKDLLQYAFNLSNNNNLITTSLLNNNFYCVSSSLQVPFTATGTYNSGNIFTAQLSDGSGNFATPVNIGTLTATSSGTINATIPANTPAGAGYRIRVVSNNPVVTGTDNGSNIAINPLPAITPTASLSACAGDANVSMAYSGATNTPVQYKIDFDANAMAAGFSNLAYTSLPVSPIVISIAGTAVAGTTYNANVTVKNANGCESSSYPITIKINPLP